MNHPVGILVNLATGRFHPIVFRPAPLPGGASLADGTERYRSKGHHTNGFDTEEEAVAWVRQHPELMLTACKWEWTARRSLR